jgi:hypothetical protein
MLYKFLHRKVSEVCNEMLIDGNKLELEYYLIEDEVDYIGELRGKKVYGISIVKKTNDTAAEEAIIRNFSCCMKSTKEVLDLLADNLVTPVHLHYVIDNILNVY